MSFLKAVTQTLGKMVRLFTQPSMQDQELHLLNANKQPVKSGQISQDAQAQQPVRKKRKPKASTAQPTTAAASRKRASKPAQTTSGKRGKQPATPASKTRQHAKRVSKAKA